MTDAANKTVLITGAGGGFGRHLVRQFRAAGATLILTDVTDSALHDVVDDAGDDLIAAVVADLASEEGCDTVAETCTSRDLVPDILVNNAGIAVAGRLDKVPRDHWERLLQLNLLAPMRLCNLFLPGMIERGSGHIVNTSSIAAYDGQIGQVAYAASKGAVVSMTLPIARDLASLGIRCCTICPGTFDTPMMGRLRDDIKAALAASIPNPSRLGNAEEYAMLVEHIISNPYLNGESIRLDGALRMAPK